MTPTTLYPRLQWATDRALRALGWLGHSIKDQHD